MKASSFISVIICSFGPYINLPLSKLNFSVASKLRETDLILVSLGSEQLKINVLSLFPPIYCEFISLISSSLHAKYFAAQDIDTFYEFMKTNRRGTMKNISDKYNGSLVNNN